MKPMFPVLVAAVLLATGPARATDPQESYYLTGKTLAEHAVEWEKSTRNDPKTNVVNASLFMGFVVGVHDASSGVCSPKEVTITQICKITANYLGTHPTELDRSAYSIVARALAQAYPCGAASRAAPQGPIAVDPPRPYYPAPHATTPRSRYGSAPSSGCESGHWIDSVSDDGDIIKLEDGSIWEVEAGDAITSALWLATTEVLVCEGKGKLINTDDNESVAVRRLK
jgi:hypothetical protein